MSTPRLIAGRYEALEVLRSDERGEELRARDVTLGREVVLVRRTKETPLLGQAAGERALREARALAGLRHPSIQKLHDVIDAGDEGAGSGPMLVLEPVAGETLAERLAREPRLEWSAVRALGLALSDALAAVHAAGAVHRDVSEANVILRTDGTPCLAGFRLAKPAALSGRTSIQYAQGLPAPEGDARTLLPTHPAPEQLGGEVASARTDLFALGCVLYRALTGRVAFPELLTSGWSPPADPARLVPMLPPAFAKLVLACLARSPIARPQSALEMRAQLEALAPESAPARSGRSPALLWGGAAAALGVALAGWQLSGRAPDPPAIRGISPDQATHGAPAPGTYQPSFAKARALLIGIDDEYQANGFQPLANAERDAQAIATALEALPADRWTTTLRLGAAATRDGIEDALAALDRELEPEDRALVYFAGHGMRHGSSESSGWILPADAQTVERDPARKKWVHFNRFAQFLDETRAKHVMIAMDCCYGGRLATMRSAEAVRAFEQSFLTRRARVVLTSGRSDEEVQDAGPRREHSPFAEVFLEHLKPGKSGITSSSLASRMLEHFHEQGVPHKPRLAHFDRDEGEFVFLLGE